MALAAAVVTSPGREEDHAVGDDDDDDDDDDDGDDVDDGDDGDGDDDASGLCAPKVFIALIMAGRVLLSTVQNRKQTRTE